MNILLFEIRFVFFNISFPFLIKLGISTNCKGFHIELFALHLATRHETQTKDKVVMIRALPCSVSNRWITMNRVIILTTLFLCPVLGRIYQPSKSELDERNVNISSAQIGQEYQVSLKSKKMVQLFNCNSIFDRD